jgi:hypothetical protein
MKIAQMSDSNMAVKNCYNSKPLWDAESIFKLKSYKK